MHALAKITNLSKICKSKWLIFKWLGEGALGSLCKDVPSPSEKKHRLGLRTNMVNLAKMANLVKICQSVSKNSNEMANGAMTSGNVDFWTYM